MDKLSGRCACGNVTWTSPGPVLWAVHCHCDSCRRANASAMVSFFGVPRETVSRIGDMTVRKSSNGVERGFCSQCGSQVLYESEVWPDETHLYAATLDDPDQFKPTAHVHWNEKVDWLKIDDDLPKYPGSADNTQPIANQY